VSQSAGNLINDKVGGRVISQPQYAWTTSKCTSSSAVAEKPRCRLSLGVGDGMGQTIDQSLFVR